MNKKGDISIGKFLGRGQFENTDHGGGYLLKALRKCLS
jgi:hypothetical protein